MADPVLDQAKDSGNVEIPPEPSVVIENEDPSPPQGADAAAEESAAPLADEALISEAREMGWKPQSEYQGDPAKWKDARAWVDSGNRVLPLVRKENRTLRTQLQTLQSQVDALLAERGERDKQREELGKETRKLQLKQALEEGDHERAAQLQSEMVEAAVGREKPAAPQIQVNPEADRIWNEFTADNPQFRNDERLGRRLFREVKNLREDGSTLVGREMLDEAADLVKRIFPDKFGRLPGRVSMAEAGGANGSARGNIRTWNDLKPEAKEVLEQMLDSVPGLSKEAILRNCAANPSQYFRR